MRECKRTARSCSTSHNNLYLDTNTQGVKHSRHIFVVALVYVYLLSYSFVSHLFFFFFSSRRRHTRWTGDWSSDVCSSDLAEARMTSVTGEVPFTMWVPLEQHVAPDGGVLVVRSSGSAASLTTAVRRAAGDLNSQVAIAKVSTMEQVLATALAQPLRLRFFLTLFGALRSEERR